MQSFWEDVFQSKQHQKAPPAGQRGNITVQKGQQPDNLLVVPLLIVGTVVAKSFFSRAHRRRLAATPGDRHEAQALAGAAALRRDQQFRARLTPATSTPHTEDATAQLDHAGAVRNQQEDVNAAPTPTALNRQHSGGAMPNSRAQENTASSARRAEYHAWNTPGYEPVTDTQDWNLSTRETAHVMDTGLEPHRARACLDSADAYILVGNDGRTMITTRFARQLGLVDFDGNPTQSQARPERSVGVVYGATLEYKVINIQYEIKGKTVYSRAGVAEQGPDVSWDLLISRREIALFEADGFSFSTR